MQSPEVIPSPNIWHWPQVYEQENRAQDAGDVIFPAIAQVCTWAGHDVVDVGCGAGFHLPRFAASARSVVGIEPHQGLAAAAARRVAALANVRVEQASAQELSLADASIDLVHARTAYFFDERCAPGIAEAMRVLRPGGWLIIVDLDATVRPYADWMRADLPRYRPAAVEAFFADQGFSMRRLHTHWKFEDRATMQAVLGIEFSKRVAARALRSIPGLAFTVGYRLHAKRKPAGLIIPE